MTRLISYCTMVFSAAAAVVLAGGTQSAAQDRRSEIGPAVHRDCLIEPRSMVDLGSAEEGIIEQILVRRGDIVAQGESVAKLEQNLTELSVELAKLRAERTEDVNSSRARLEFEHREMARMQELHDRNVVSTRSRDEAETDRHLAELALSAAEWDLREAELEFQRARSRLDRHTIRSPVTGVVSEILMSAGEYAYEQSPIMRIAEIDPLHVEVFLPVSEYRDVVEGMIADVMPEAPVSGLYEARVTVIDRVFDSASGTFGVRLELANPDYEIPAGLRCQVRFRSRENVAAAATWSMTDFMIDEAEAVLDNGVRSAEMADDWGGVVPPLSPSASDVGPDLEDAAALAGEDLTFLIQEKLASAGFEVGPLDGVLGPRTEAAIVSYQVQHGLTPDGSPSGTLFDHLQDPDVAEPGDVAAAADPPATVDPSDIGYDYLRRAAHASDRGDYRLAAFLYTRAIEAGKLLPLHRAYAFNNRGALEAARGRFEEAVLDFDQAIELDPDSVAAFLNRAEAHFSSGRYESAIEDFDSAIGLEPDLADAHYRRGVSLSQLGEIERAIESYDAAIRLSPDLVPAFMDRGRAYQTIGRQDEALINFARVFENDPRYPGLRSEMERIGIHDCSDPTESDCPALGVLKNGAVASKPR